MSTGARNSEPSIAIRARDLAANVFIFGGAQILLALLFWQTLFRSHPQGFAMGLTLVGFGSWTISLLTSSRRRRWSTPSGMGFPQQAPQPKASTQRSDGPTTTKLQEQLGSAGCGTVLFLSGLVSLGLAFALRVRADMQTGKTWSDIFPTGP